jgi:NAD dependent epimerase/dehydratase
MNMRRVFITGADGFIGSHLTEALVQAGHEVRALSLYNSFGTNGWLDTVADDLVGQFETVSGDIRDPDLMRSLVQDCDVVLHLAALVAIPYSYRAPQSYVDTNVLGTLNLLQAGRAAGVARFVHTSTSEVYGTARTVPISEDHPLQPQSPYSASKIAADSMAQAFHASFDLPVCTIRPFNTYGPRQSTRAVIPTIITQLAAGARQIKLGSTSPTRDFNLVGDTVRGFLAMMHNEAAVGETVNIGSGFEISIGDMAALIAEVMSVEAEIVCEEDRLRPPASEVERLCADNAKAARLLQWSPQYAGREGLFRGISETVAWFTEPNNLARYRADAYVI